MLGIIIGILILVLIIFYAIGVYNSLVQLRNSVEQAFSTIDVYLKKRYDLIPNLVETVKKYMSHESDTLTKITELRSKATSSDVSMDEKIELNNQLSNELRSLMVQVEAYPDLKASQNFTQLQNSLSSLESEIASSRQMYNNTVLTYNNKCMIFPSNIFAGMFNFKTANMFKAAEAERENVSVKNLFNN